MNAKKKKLRSLLLYANLGAFVASWCAGCSNDSTVVAPGDPAENRKKKFEAIKRGSALPRKNRKAQPGDDI